MDSLEAYRIYKSVFLHFTNAKWNPDNLKNGKFMIKCNIESFIRRNDYPIFNYISKKFTRKEWFRFIVANAMYGFSECIYNIEAGKHNMNVWEGRRLRLSYIYHSDIETLKPSLTNNIVKDSLTIIKYLSMEKMSIETVGAINTYFKITDVIRNSEHYSPIIEPLLLRIDRTLPFVKVPDDCNQIFENLLG